MPHLSQGCSKVEVVLIVDEIVSKEFDSELEVDGEVLEVGTELVFEDLLRHGSKLLLLVMGECGNVRWEVPEVSVWDKLALR
jgi:hypothetical protein